MSSIYRSLFPDAGEVRSYGHQFGKPTFTLQFPSIAAAKRYVYPAPPIRGDLLEACSYGSWGENGTIRYWRSCPDGFEPDTEFRDVQLTSKRGSTGKLPWAEFAPWFRDAGVTAPVPIFRRKPERWTFRFENSSDAVAFKLRFADDIALNT